MKGEHLVLRHKVSKKIASRSDQRAKALALDALRLTNEGMGGGIAELLLPKSPQGHDELTQIGETYVVCRVKNRPGHKSGQSDRKALKVALSDDELFAILVVNYGKYIGNKPDPQRVSAKAFTGWLKRELKNPASRAYKAIRALAPVLLELKRGDRWWESAIAERRKRRVKDI